jgi:hypothetical protein
VVAAGRRPPPPGFHIVQAGGQLRRLDLGPSPSQRGPATGAEAGRTTNAIWYDLGNVSRVVTPTGGRVQHDDAFACPFRLPDLAFGDPSKITGRWTSRNTGNPTSPPSRVMWIAPRQPSSQRLRASASGSPRPRTPGAVADACTTTARSLGSAGARAQARHLRGRVRVCGAMRPRGLPRNQPAPKLSAREPYALWRATRASDRGRSGSALPWPAPGGGDDFYLRPHKHQFEGAAYVVYTTGSLNSTLES